jgi:hypothetical protein
MRHESYNELILIIISVVSFMGIDAMRWNEIHVDESFARKVWWGRVWNWIFEAIAFAMNRRASRTSLWKPGINGAGVVFGTNQMS